jgi:hypothetical protein
MVGSRNFISFLFDGASAPSQVRNASMTLSSLFVDQFSLANKPFALEVALCVLAFCVKILISFLKGFCRVGRRGEHRLWTVSFREHSVRRVVFGSVGSEVDGRALAVWRLVIWIQFQVVVFC